MNKRYYLHYVSFLVLALFGFLLIPKDVNAENITDKLTEKILFTQNPGSVLCDNPSGSSSIGPYCSEYMVNNIKFYSMTKENFITRLLNSGMNLIVLPNGKMVINVDKLTDFTEPVVLNGHTYTSYNLLFDYKTSVFMDFLQQQYFYSADLYVNDYLVFYNLANEFTDMTDFDPYYTYNSYRYLAYAVKTLHKENDWKVASFHFDSLDDIHTLKNLYNVNGELLKRSDIYFSENNNPIDYVSVATPDTICYTDSFSEKCSSDITTKNILNRNFYTSSVIEDILYTGSTDNIPQTIDFHYSTVPMQDLGSSVIINFDISSLGATVPDLTFTGSLQVGDNIYSCTVDASRNSHSFSCTVYNSFSETDPMTLHLDFENIPTNQAFDIHLGENFEYRYIVDSVSPPDPDEPEDNRTFFEKVLDFPKEIASEFTKAFENLFIPPTQDLQALLEDFKETIVSKLGFVGQSFDLVISFVQEILGTNASSTSAKTCINFPKIQVQEYVLYEGSCVQVIPEGFEDIVEVLKVIINIICTILFVNMCKNKVDQFLGGREDKL